MTITNSIQLGDNAYGTIGSGLAVGDTALTFTTGHGARFPAVAAGQVLYCCLLNSNNVIEEIQITAHASGSDSATIVRGANSTTAKVWNSGDLIQARLSSEVLKRVAQEALIEVALTTADAGATYTGMTSPTRLGYINGVVYPLSLQTTNSGATPTIALDGLPAVTVKLNGGGALAASQLPLHGFYQYDGTNFILLNPVYSYTINSANAPGSISNSAVATDVYTTSIPANILGTTRSLSVEIDGEFLSFVGVPCTFRWQLKYGGTVLADTGAVSYSSDATAHAWKLVATIAASGATNAQKTNAAFNNASSGTVAGVMSATGDFLISCANSLAIDSTAAQNLVLTCTIGATSLFGTLNVRHAHVILN